MDGAICSLPMEKLQVKVIGDLGEDVRGRDEDKGGPVLSLEIAEWGSP